MASVNVDRVIQSALDFLVTRGRSVVLKREKKQAIVSLLNGEGVQAVLPTGFGKSMIFTVFGIAESEKVEGPPVSVLVICPLKSIISDQILQLEGLCSAAEFTPESYYSKILLSSSTALQSKCWMNASFRR